MSRLIKFRAWDANDKSMFEPISLDYMTKKSQGYWGTGNGWSDKTTWLQFTGLHDKNGKEIYEGDVVRYSNGDIGHITWVPQDARYQFASIPYLGTYDFTPSETDTLYEVIGNIYENPELLESPKI